MLYNEDIGVRRASAKRRGAALEHPFLERVRAYSYEAVPYTKVFSALGINVRLFNFDRPPRVVSALAEQPNLLLAVVAFLVAALAMLSLHASGACRAAYRRIVEGKVLRSPRGCPS